MGKLGATLQQPGPRTPAGFGPPRTPFSRFQGRLGPFQSVLASRVALDSRPPPRIRVCSLIYSHPIPKAPSALRPFRFVSSIYFSRAARPTSRVRPFMQRAMRTPAGRSHRSHTYIPHPRPMSSRAEILFGDSGRREPPASGRTATRSPVVLVAEERFHPALLKSPELADICRPGRWPGVPEGHPDAPSPRRPAADDRAHRRLQQSNDVPKYNLQMAPERYTSMV